MPLDLNLFLFPLTILVALVVLMLIIWLVLEGLRNKGFITRSLNMSLFLITLPKRELKEGQTKNEKELIAIMEQFYASLSSLREKGLKTFFYGQPYMVFEIATPHKGEEISFYAALPRRYEAVIEKTIHGFYPEADVIKVDDYNIFNPQGATAGSILKLSQSSVFPFKTYANLEVDPLNEIANSLSKLEARGEGAALQILIKPAKKDWQKISLAIVKEMQQGKSYKTAYAKAIQGGMEKLLSRLLPAPAKKEKEEMSSLESKTPTGLEQEYIKAIESKAGKITFETNIRLLASAQTQTRAGQILEHLESAFTQFTLPNINSFKIIRLKGRKLKQLVYNFSFRIFNQNQMAVLNTEELSSIYHFPIIALATPKIKFMKAKQAAPPANLPQEGIILGKNIYRGIESVIRFNDEDRRRHLYIIGQTGTGKSALLKEMMRQDIKTGKGICFLDPHGDAAEAVLGYIPQERIEDVVYFDPANLERPMGLNMLEYNPQRPEQKSFIANELINIFDKLYNLRETGGPLFEQVTRNALMLLMDDPQEPVTLMEVPKVLSNKEYRERLLSKCKNTVVKDFWEREIGQVKGEHALAELVPYITSKFNIFTTNDYMRPVIGQVKSSFNFREVLDEGKILLVNLSKGRLGDINSNLLGLIIVGKILVAALSRADLPEEARQDFYLYIDEFQNVTTEGIATILAEARKYRLDLIIAHQFIKQLPENIQSAVFGNVGSKVAFRVGVEDAPILIKEFEPAFNENDLINLDNFNAYLKLMIHNQVGAPFNIATYPPVSGNVEVAQSIKELSNLKHGREREQVEHEIMERGRV